MLFEEKKVGNVLVIEVLEPRLDARIAVDFKQQVIERIQKGEKTLLLSLKNVNFIDSSGLGAIVSCLKALGREGDLVISGVQDTVHSLFKLTRMDKVFRLFPGEVEALQALSN